MRNRDRLEDKFRHHIHGKRYGEIVSLFQGFGIEVADSRQYQPGDHSKHINRKLSAKHDKLYVNTYQSELSPEIDVFLDINRNWISGQNHALGDEVLTFLADFGLTVERWHATTNLWWYDNRLETQEFSQRADRVGGLPDLASTIKQLGRRERVHSTHISDFCDLLLTKRTNRRVVVVISDFLSPDRDVEQSLQVVQKRHLPAYIQLPVGTVVGANFDVLTSSVPQSMVTPTLILAD